MQDARHAHRVPDANLKPEEPTGVYVKIPSTTSKSRLVRHLADAGDVGCCMTTTEINTLTDAMEVDCGHYEDILCKAAHHEEVSLSYRIDGDPVVARRPRLAISMAGTPEQFIRFFRSLEVGLYSRFACYTCARQLEWKSCAPTASHTDLAAYFSEAGKQLLVMHLGLLESPTNVVFSDEQWEEHTAFFSALLTHTLVEGRQSHAAIIYRSGLLAMRLAAILTVFRKWEDYRYAHDYRCTDEDFHAALALVRVLVEHSLLLSATLPDTLTAPKPVHKFRLLDEILSSLGKKFTYTEFVHLACELGASQSTAKRTLRRAVECQLVEKEEDGYKKSARKTKKVGSK